MTWLMLMQRISEMSETEMNQDVTVFLKLQGEVFKCDTIDSIETVDQNGDTNGVLDDGHIVLMIEA